MTTPPTKARVDRKYLPARGELRPGSTSGEEGWGGGGEALEGVGGLHLLAGDAEEVHDRVEVRHVHGGVGGLLHDRLGVEGDAEAGLGIAYNAKEVVRDAADTAVNVPYLDAIMYLLGISREEIEAADAEAGIVTPAPPV